MSRTKCGLTIVAAVAGALIGQIASAAESAEFIPLSKTCGPAFFPQFCIVDMSGDGKTLLYRDAIWTEASGFVPIAGPPGGFETVALSDDGSTVVGTVGFTDDPLGPREESAVWRGGDQWQGLGALPGASPCGTSYSSSFDVSGDGKTVVGLSWIGPTCSGAHGFRWNASTGMQDLGSLVANRSSRANTISADGQVIAGWSDSEFGARLGAIWNADGLHWFAAPDAPQSVGEAIGANSDGTTIVGGGYSSVDKPLSFSLPWIWTKRTGVVPLGAAKGLRGDVVDGQHYAHDVSDDGTVVAGQVTLFTLGEQWAWIWTKSRGTELLQDYLRRVGNAATRAALCPGQRGPLQPCRGWDLWNVAAISNDGKTIVGTGANPNGIFQAFMVKRHD